MALSREPSIAVLPFANMSGDPAQDYFGSGIAEDIITMLSSYPDLRVVSRSSSSVYDKPVKVQQVGEDLKVSYVIEGSVRRAGGKVRVTAQLVDASDGRTCLGQIAMTKRAVMWRSCRTTLPTG